MVDYSSPHPKDKNSEPIIKPTPKLQNVSYFSHGLYHSLSFCLSAPVNWSTFKPGWYFSLFRSHSQHLFTANYGLTYMVNNTISVWPNPSKLLVWPLLQNVNIVSITNTISTLGFNKESLVSCNTSVYRLKKELEELLTNNN